MPPRGAETTLTIKVNDREVDEKGIASINRMKKAADDLNKSGANVFGGGGKAAESDEQRKKLSNWLANEMPKASNAATQAIAETETAVAGAATEFGGLAAIAGPVGVGLGIVTAAALALITVAFTLGNQVFNLSKGFAEYAIEIRNVSEATGLATETVAALRHEAEAQGRSFDAVEGSVKELSEPGAIATG